MFELKVIEWILVISAAFCVGFTKTGISGLGIIAVPLMAAVFPAKESTGILLPLLIFADIEHVELVGGRYWYVWSEDNVTDHMRSQLTDLGWQEEIQDGVDHIWVCCI